MNKSFFQCCFTNAIADETNKNAGWGAVAISNNIPIDAYEECVKKQNNNSIISNNINDENGEILNLFELETDSKYIYIMRTQYGLHDSVGRNNLFSHAYIIPYNENNALIDPNEFLTISDANFKKNIKEASNFIEDFQRDQVFAFDEVLNRLHMTKNEYLIMIKCVYAKLKSNKSKPLYIQYDGTEGQMKDIIYLIFYGLPYCLRKGISIASCPTNNTNKKTIVFSKNAESYPLYLFPSNGENNILDRRTEKMIAKYGYLDYPILNLDSSQYMSYFNYLEEECSKLGDSTASNETLLKIINVLRKIDNELDLLTDEKIVDVTIDVLSLNIRSEELRNLLLELIKIILARNLKLITEVEQILISFQNTVSNSVLIDTIDKYFIKRIYDVEESEGVNKLNLLTPEQFKRYETALKIDAKGKKYLDAYYCEQLNNLTDVTWEELDLFYLKLENCNNPSKLETRLDDVSYKLYRELIMTKVNKAEEYYNYINFANKIPTIDPSFKVYAKIFYWNQFDFNHFDLKNKEEYMCFKQLDHKKCKLVFDFYDLIQHLQNEQDVDNVLKRVNWFYINSRETINSLIDVDKIFYDLIKEILNNNGLYRNYNVDKWLLFATKADDFNNNLSIQINNNLLEKKYEQVVNCLEEVSDLTINKEIFDIVSDILLEEETENLGSNMNCLDLWLLISKMKYGNAFTIFDAYKLSICKKDSFGLIKNSKYMEDDKYIQDAKTYVKERGQEYRFVKTLLSEIKNVEKSERKKNKSSFTSYFTHTNRITPDKESAKEVEDSKNKKDNSWFSTIDDREDDISIPFQKNKENQNDFNYLEVEQSSRQTETSKNTGLSKKEDHKKVGFFQKHFRK